MTSVHALHKLNGDSLDEFIDNIKHFNEVLDTDSHNLLVQT